MDTINIRDINDFSNQNGLQNGKIPVGTPCPWYATCKLKTSNCPTPIKLNSQPFSCAAARAYSLIKMSEE
jgi:hypothetical protein